MEYSIYVYPIIHYKYFVENIITIVIKRGYYKEYAIPINPDRA